MATLVGPFVLSLVAMVLIAILGYAGLVQKLDCTRYGIAITAIDGLGGYTLRHAVGMVRPRKGV